MIGKTSQSQVRPVALGATVQSSTYGATIPVIIGRTKSALFLIWAANLRQVDNGGKKGKGKKGKKGKSQPQYAQNVDFLLSHNPVATVLQFWENQNTKYPLNFVRYSGSLTVPDSNFYAVIGVTSSESYVFGVNDYGGPGPQTLTGHWEVPCWNTAYIGPNPTRPASFLYSPYTYRWTPAQGNVLTCDPGSAIQLARNIYYAELWPTGSNSANKGKNGTAVPAGQLNLTFESVLGEGPEFVGNDQITGQPLNQQQILYPMYCGLGSPQLNMGSSTAIPDIRCEVLGAYPLYATGDAEFADMLEDIVAQGISQAGAAVEYQYDGNGGVVVLNGPGQDPIQAILEQLDEQGNIVSDPVLTTPPFSKVQHGLGAFDFPGPIQMKHAGSVEAFTRGPILFDQPNTAGNILVVLATGGFESSPGPISDTAGNAWTQLFPSGLNYQVWYATNIPAFTNNIVTVGGLSYNWSLTIMEIAGVDTFDGFTIATTNPDGSLSASLTTTNAVGFPDWLLACSFSVGTIRCKDPHTPLWDTLSTDIYNQNDAGGTESFALSIDHQLFQTRTVYGPVPITFTLPQQAVFPGKADACVLIAFKSTQPSPWPRSLGRLLDTETLNMTRRQCRAFGLYGSLVMDSQQKCADWMDGLYQAMNAAPVWSGFTLKSIPKSEVSFAGNGMLYSAYTASGPRYRLQEADFITSQDQPLFSVERAARTDLPNILQIQCPNRDSDYNDVTVSQPETGSIALYSPRKDSPKQMRMIQDPLVARKILDVLVRDRNYLPDTYKFTLPAKFKLLEPMDLITLPDPQTGLNLDADGNDISIPVQLTEVNESANYDLECSALPFIYGCHAPLDLPVTVGTRAPVSTGSSPGAINTPIIFEPPARLIAQQNQGEVWAVVSHAFVAAPTAAPVPTAGSGSLPAGSYYVQVSYVNAVGGESQASPESAVVTLASAGSLVIPSPPSAAGATHWNVYITNGAKGTETRQNSTPIAMGTGYTQSAALVQGQPLPQNSYGGSIVYLSTDGGDSYHQVGVIGDSAITGVTTADWPAAADPDTTNNLLLDLTESAGALESVSVADEDNFLYPCYVEGGGTNFIPYELMSYAVATLTTAYHYTLSATSPNHLRRSLYGCPQAGSGVDHPSGSRWAFLPPGTAGIFKIDMDPLWIGQTLYFKFLPFNAFGGGTGSLADATAYPYTPIGVAAASNPNAANYTISPANALSNPTATTIHMDQVTAAFPSNAAIYNARTFTITAPTAPTTYYVTIADPGFLGDTGSATNLSAYAETTTAKVGLAGYTYIGSVVAQPSGGGESAGGGGTSNFPGDGQPFLVICYLEGKPLAGEVVLKMEIPSNLGKVIFPANFSGSVANAGVSPAASATYTISQNGSSIGTIVIATSGVATFTTTGGSIQTLVANDLLTITAPSSQDGSLSTVTITLAGTR